MVDDGKYPARLISTLHEKDNIVNLTFEIAHYSKRIEVVKTIDLTNKEDVAFLLCVMDELVYAFENHERIFYIPLRIEIKNGEISSKFIQTNSSSWI